MTSLLILLGVALSSLTVYADMLSQIGFDVNKIKGKWYDIGIASDHPVFEKEKSKMRIGFCILDPAENGDLWFSEKALGHEGKCETFNFMGKGVSVPGVFTYTANGGSSIMTIHEIKEDEYFFLYTKAVNAECVVRLTKLLAREQEVSDAVKEKWQKWTESLGISTENITFIPKEGGCTE